MYYLYILYSTEANKFYVGQSDQPQERYLQHVENKGETFHRKHSAWMLNAHFETTKSTETMMLKWGKH